MSQSTRLLSLDAFRGAAIAMMFVVGSKSPVEQFRHIDWFGYTAADLVYPFFLFVVGFSMLLSTRKKDSLDIPKIQQRNVMLQRLFYLFLIGCFLRSVSYSRVYLNLGTLQCIALCALIGYLFVRCSNLQRGLAIAAAYIIVCLLHSFGCDAPSAELFCWEKGTTTGELIDAYILGKHKASEGIVGTLSLATLVIWGQIAASCYLKDGAAKSCISRYALIGVLALIGGYLLSGQAILYIPVSPKIATPSFCLIAAGWSLLAIGMLFLVIERWKFAAWAKPFVILGANPITVYVLVKLVDKWIFKTWNVTIGDQLYTYKSAAEYIAAGAFDPYYAQLGPVVLKLAAAWIIAVILWRKKLFIKL